MTPIEIPNGTAALIFDLDGTLADTMPLHYRAWQEALAPFGASFPEELFYSWAGVPSREIVRRLNERHGGHWPMEEVRARKQERIMQLMHEVRPIGPVVAIAREYAGRLPMAVASGGIGRVCAAVISAIGLDGVFETVVTSDDVDHGKPAPDIFLETARRLCVEPSCCLVFEDGEPGIQAAEAAGMPWIDVRPMIASAGVIPA